jgi:quinol monooxygenase YgiN
LPRTLSSKELPVPVLVATITPKPDQMDAAIAALKELIPAVHDEDGCERYALHRGPDRLVFIEKWRDMATLGAHGSGPNIAKLGEKLAGLTAGAPDIQVLEAVPVGDAVKGAI